MKWFKGLSKWARIGITALLAVVVASTVAWAAWQFTKQSTGTAMVFGSFSVTEMTCEDVYSGDEDVDKLCLIPLVNSSGGPMTILNVVMTEDWPVGISCPGDWQVQGYGNPADWRVPVQIPAGAEVVVVSKYRVSTVTGLEGVINFTAQVTASGG